MKAIIFDMNGVIINDEKFHNESWVEFCKRYGFTLSEKEFSTEVMGKRDKETFEYLFKKKFTLEEVDKYGNERDEIVQGLIKGKIQATEELINLLEEIKQENIPLAIATSSRRGYMNFIVDILDIRRYFQYIVTSEDINNGKPNPEIYLKTASLLQVNSEECLVFEDSLSGVKAAKAAGMKVVGITTTHTKEELNLADKVIDDFTQVSIVNLRSI